MLGRIVLGLSDLFGVVQRNLCDEFGDRPFQPKPFTRDAPTGEEFVCFSLLLFCGFDHPQQFDIARAITADFTKAAKRIRRPANFDPSLAIASRIDKAAHDARGAAVAQRAARRCATLLRIGGWTLTAILDAP